MCGLAQADPAEAELAVVGARAPATTAAVVAPGLVLGLAPLSNFLGSLCHWVLFLAFLRFRFSLRGGLAALASFAAPFAFLAFLVLFSDGLLVGLGVLFLELL
jgi:hypothetical protein